MFITRVYTVHTHMRKRRERNVRGKCSLAYISPFIHYFLVNIHIPKNETLIQWWDDNILSDDLQLKGSYRLNNVVILLVR